MSFEVHSEGSEKNASQITKMCRFTVACCVCNHEHFSGWMNMQDVPLGQYPLCLK